jgi:hypothetical protein
MLFWFSGFVALGVFLSGRICFGMVCCHSLFLEEVAVALGGRGVRTRVWEEIDDRLLTRRLGLRYSTREHCYQRSQLVGVDRHLRPWRHWGC